MSVDAHLFQHADFAGRSIFASLPSENIPLTYFPASYPRFVDAGMNDRASSLRLAVSPWDAGGRLLIFKHAGYSGAFAHFTAEPGTTTSVNSLSGVRMNDNVSSAILVRRFRQEFPPVAIGDMGSPSLREQIRTFVDSLSGLNSRGDPLITWHMWPDFAPSRRYLHVKVPAWAVIDGWADYEVELRLWIDVFIDNAGIMQGFIDYYGAWVEGGILTGRVLRRVMSGLETNLPQISAMLAATLRPLQMFRFAHVYLLPGFAGDTGSTADDVSVVLVKEI